jgi:hypothetical protein
MRCGHAFKLLTGIFTIFLISGCGGDSSLPKTAKVKGTVTYKGKPLAGGQISFIPEAGSEAAKNGQPASGQINADGTFTLTTFNTGDGALLGAHKVIVSKRSNDTQRNQPKPDGTIDYTVPKAEIPVNYESIDKTPLKFTVEDKSNEFKIELVD